MSYIQQAVDLAGGQIKMAEAVGVTPQAVSKWLKHGFVPPGSALAVWEACKHKVSVHRLLQEAEDARHGGVE